MRGTDESDGAVVVIVTFSFKLKYSATLRSIRIPRDRLAC
jgi:hypothetical protein